MRRVSMVIVYGLAIVIALQIANAQTFTVLHQFTGGRDGKLPATGVLDVGGNFYGTTQAGGDTQTCGGGGCGAVFKLAPRNGAWVLSTLHNFTGGADGSKPQSGVSFGPDGNLYGTTLSGGGSECGVGCGIVFKLHPPATFCRSVQCPWTEAILHGLHRRK